ncbi:phospholipase A1-like isoform X1 [Harmonia axyridis]|uniref:phospholipase A1-like isoform X1 n=1 Tax=Harmonia axyridis TaxID=115357 RepID=UPI001E279465|nr:phospholipase A1-like isoform X1 [Harmonia axyridis]
MKLLFCAFVCGLLTDGSYVRSWDLPNPIAAAGKAVDEIGSGVEEVGEEVVKAANETVYEADKHVEGGAKTVLGQVHKGAFAVEKGVVNGLKEVVGTPVNLEQLTFHLVTKENLDNPKKINFYEPDDVANTKGKIFFIIHGWHSSINASWIRNISEILIRTRPGAHVVQVNWDGPASDTYPFSAFDTESAGNFVGILVNRLVKDYKIPRENIVLVGHSLGGQICGWAGKKFGEISGQKLKRIVALDPAGPLFDLRPDSKRLNKHDAEVVMVIHTDGDKLGFLSPCGTIDFFPNGGENQPGCWDVNLKNVSTYTEPVTCDHSRAWDFFVEAVNNTGSFPSKKCNSYSDFKKNKCEAIEAAMGDLDVKHEGKFYLKTDDKRPYSLPLPEVIEAIKEGIEKIKEEIDKMSHKNTTKSSSSE